MIFFLVKSVARVFCPQCVSPSSFFLSFLPWVWIYTSKRQLSLQVCTVGHRSVLLRAFTLPFQVDPRRTAHTLQGITEQHYSSMSGTETVPQAFLCLWQDEHIREVIFQLLPKEDICNVRLASSVCCKVTTRRLFLRANVSFNPNTFTKQYRIEALSRIGHYIEHLTFLFPYCGATFLPPLIDETGREISFLYTPNTSTAAKFTSEESDLRKILTDQYPPLFHAACNVPSFINALRNMPNIRHITIKTPGQRPEERYRRGIVDYALSSLRVSMERAPLPKLMKLSLSSVHPSAFVYLRHVPGFGCIPSAGKRWKQIRKLHISVEAWNFDGPSPGLDHLKIIEDYICSFSGCLEKLTFTWLGRKGPCPIALAQHPLFTPPGSSQKLIEEVAPPASSKRKPIKLRKLRNLSLHNATLSVPQVTEVISSHQHHMRQFDFQNAALINDGSWDAILALLRDNSSSGKHWVVTDNSTADNLRFPSTAMMSLGNEIMSVDRIEGLDGLSFYQEPQ